MADQQTTDLPRQAALAKKSKSKSKKSDRAPYKPTNLIAPDLTDGYRTMGYVYQRAEMGEFDSAPGGTVGVLIYLANFTWRSDDNNENVPVGTVMGRKSPLAKIAASTGLSYWGARNAINWLHDYGWIRASLDVDNTQRFVLLLDDAGEKSRAVVPQPTGAEAVGSHATGVLDASQQGLVPDATPSCTGANTVQRDLQGSYKVLDNDVVGRAFEGQDQNQRPAGADSGHGDTPSDDDLRAEVEKLIAELMSLSPDFTETWLRDDIARMSPERRLQEGITRRLATAHCRAVAGRLAGLSHAPQELPEGGFEFFRI